MNADNNLETAGLLDLKEIEAAPPSKLVNVIVQIDRAEGEAVSDEDWTTTRRYRIKNDEDASLIDAELVAELGEIKVNDYV